MSLNYEIWKYLQFSKRFFYLAVVQTFQRHLIANHAGKLVSELVKFTSVTGYKIAKIWEESQEHVWTGKTGEKVSGINLKF